MTREEAIEKLHWFALDNRDKQIIDMAIEALTSQNLTTPNNTCEVDLISRADAIELCAEAQGRASTKSELKGISKVWQGLLKLPAAGRPQGEWIFNPTDAIDLMFAKPKCSKCGFESSDGGNFCPNCGTEMMTKESEEDANGE